MRDSVFQTRPTLPFPWVGMGEEEDEFRTAMTLELVGLIMVSVLEEPAEGEGLMVETPRVYGG